MTNFSTINATTPPPLPPAHPHNSKMSPLTAVLCLVALITIPMLSYTFFMALRCHRQRSPSAPAAEVSCKASRVEIVCGVKYKNSPAGSNSGENCPVCLSLFAEGEEIRQLSACNHAFHTACVDMWLYSHSSCPVCRAAVPVKRSKLVLADGEDDFRHGLPDAATLI